MSVSLLARLLADVVDDQLATTRRLAEEDTWIGPVAQALRDDLLILHHRLRRLADEWMALGHQLAEP